MCVLTRKVSIMAHILNSLSIFKRGLRYKLNIAFFLMSLIPLFVMGYIITHFVTEPEQNVLSTLILVVSLLISWLGLFIIKSIVEPIIDMSIEARMIAKGDYDKRITVDGDDEIGALGGSVNLMVKRVRDSMFELRDYSDKAKEINLEIQKKMSVLGDLLELGDLIAGPPDLDRVIDVVLDKLANIYENGFAILYLAGGEEGRFTMAACKNLNQGDLKDLTIALDKDFLGKAAINGKTVIIDSSTPRTSYEYAFRNRFKLKNALITPIITAEKIRGMLITGNSIPEFAYTNEDVDVIKAFVKQLSIAVENHSLVEKTKLLSVKDAVTGLYNRENILKYLKEEVSRALVFHRCCSFILIDVDNFRAYGIVRGQLAADSILRKVAKTVEQTAKEPIDKAGRIENDQFAVVLPEKNKKQAIAVAEDLRKKIQGISVSDLVHEGITASLGVSESPIDGMSAIELYDKAISLVRKAKIEGKNKVEA